MLLRHHLPSHSRVCSIARLRFDGSGLTRARLPLADPEHASQRVDRDGVGGQELHHAVLVRSWRRADRLFWHSVLGERLLRPVTRFGSLARLMFPCSRSCHVSSVPSIVAPLRITVSCCVLDSGLIDAS